MSHIVKIKTQVRDVNAIRQSCVRLQLEPPTEGEFQLFNSTESGWGVRLRDWKYPVVCQVESGELRYDNYGGRWGSSDRLDEFLQRYAVEKSQIEAHRQGHSCREQILENGDIQVTIEVGGEA